jgi:ApbE superfamily uncharacterized protein (UPF0280 family)
LIVFGGEDVIGAADAATVLAKRESARANLRTDFINASGDVQTRRIVALQVKRYIL